MPLLYTYLSDFFCLFFPELCAGCGTNLLSSEEVICTNCLYNLPVTNFHNDPGNRLAKQFWGRLDFHQVTAYVYFRKGSTVQSIMHQLKYNNRPEVGFRMGKLYAFTLQDSDNWHKPDLIIPVPLHPKKKKKRGYNQSESIAFGMASILAVPVSTDILVRTENTSTQTKKSRFGRYENLRNSFICADESILINKHILMVDDVITTGATLEACSYVLHKISNVRISIAAIAFAE